MRPWLCSGPWVTLYCFAWGQRRGVSRGICEWWDGGREQEGAHSREYQNKCKGAAAAETKDRTNREHKLSPTSRRARGSHGHRLLTKQGLCGVQSPSLLLRSSSPKPLLVRPLTQLLPAPCPGGAPPFPAVVPECSMSNCQQPTANNQRPTANHQPLTSLLQHLSTGAFPAFPYLFPRAGPGPSRANSSLPAAGLQHSGTFCSPPRSNPHILSCGLKPCAAASLPWGRAEWPLLQNRRVKAGFSAI